MVEKKDVTHRLKPYYPMIGFTTNKGLLLDLDRIPYKIVRQLSLGFCRRYRLEGFIIAETSKGNYNVIFNKPLKTEQIHALGGKAYFYLLTACGKNKANQYGLWFILQCVKKAMTVRVSPKLHKPEPKIVMTYGKTDKICKDYIETKQLMKNIQP